MITNSLFTFGLGILAIFLACCVISILYRNKLLGVTLIYTLFILTALWRDASPTIQIGTISVYPLDILSVLLLMVSLLNIFNKKLWRMPYIFTLMMFSILILLSIGSGALNFGIQKSLNSARAYIYFISVMLYVASLKFTKSLFDHILRSWSYASIALIIVTLVRWVLTLHGIHFNFARSVSGDYYRVLPANETFFLCQSAIIAWYAQRNSWKFPLKKYLPLILIPIVIIMQHRTVWVVILISFTLMLFFEKRARGRLIVNSVVSVILILVIGFLVIGNHFVVSFRESTQNMGTFDWRLESWRLLLAENGTGGNFVKIFGHPFGSGYGRLLYGNIVDISPHNYFVQVYWDLGLLGFSMIFGIYFLLVKYFYTTRYQSGFQSLALILLIGQLVFFIPYSPNFEQGLFLGLALNFLRKFHVSSRSKMITINHNKTATIPLQG